MNEDIRWIQRFDNYKKAMKQLTDAVNLSKKRNLTELESQGLVQVFEYTHELAWKTLKDFLEEKGNDNIYGSKDATRKAFELEIIKNGEIWMNMIKSRNLSTHTYNKDTVDQITKNILEVYFDEFVSFEKTMSQLEKEA